MMLPTYVGQFICQIWMYMFAEYLHVEIIRQSDASLVRYEEILFEYTTQSILFADKLGHIIEYLDCFVVCPSSAPQNTHTTTLPYV